MGESPRIEELKRRVQVDPASIAFAALAEEYRRAGRFEEAIATCQSGLQRHPAYLSAHVTLGRALLELGRFDEARQELEHVLRAAPENLAAIRGLAEIHHRRGELPEALEQYRSALHVAKHDAELADTVDQISKQVGVGGSAPVPTPGGLATAVVEPRPAPRPIQLVTRPEPAADPQPEVHITTPEPVVQVPEPEEGPAVPSLPAPEPVPVFQTAPPSEAAPTALAAPTFAPDPVFDELPAEAILAPDLIEWPVAQDEIQTEPAPDPALIALEDFLSAILREKDLLGASANHRR